MTNFYAVAKKVLTVLLRLIGCLLLNELIGTAADFLDGWLYLMYGAERVVGTESVIYIGDLWEYDYTNPAAMIQSRMTIFFGIALTVLSLSVLAAWGVQRLKLFLRVGKFDKCLIAALILSAAVRVFFGGMLSLENMVHAKRYRAVESCKNLADYEKLLGRPLFAGTVRESDRAWVEALGNFQNSGFAPGRTLAIFGMDRPRVYVLVWMENGQVVKRNGCYKTDRRPGTEPGPVRRRGR